MCAVRVVWPWACRRWGCVSTAALPLCLLSGSTEGAGSTAQRWGFWATALLSSWLGQRWGSPSSASSFLKASLKNLLLPPLQGQPGHCGFSSAQDSGFRPTKLLLGGGWLRLCVIHLPRGIVEEFLCRVVLFSLFWWTLVVSLLCTKCLVKLYNGPFWANIWNQVENTSPVDLQKKFPKRKSY